MVTSTAESERSRFHYFTLNGLDRQKMLSLFLSNQLDKILLGKRRLFGTGAATRLRRVSLGYLGVFPI